MKILKLKLRGAIGIMKGLGKEEIEIDFTQPSEEVIAKFNDKNWFIELLSKLKAKFLPGLIALTGKNGSGKTTVMENLHPYRCMVSRTGSLQSHFFLKDSCRILVFEIGGNIYEAKILIDALTGGSEAYLICNGTPINDGKLTTYDEVIEAVLGSQELFFNSVFSGQKSKGIAELKPAERRKLFYELLNLNVYETYLEESKSELKRKELKLAEIEGQINSLAVGDTDKEQLEKSRVEALDKIAQMEIEISKVEAQLDQSNSYIKGCEIEIAKLEEKKKANAEIETKISELRNRSITLSQLQNKKLENYNADLEDCKKLISHNQKLLQNKAEIEKSVEQKNKLSNELSKLKSRESDFTKQKSDLFEVYSNKVEKINEKQNHLNELKIKENTLTSEYKQLLKNIAQMEKSTELIKDVPCTEEVGSSCQFLSNAYSDKAKLNNEIQKKNDVSEKLSKIMIDVQKLSSEINTEKQLLNEKYELDSGNVKREIGKIGVEITEKENLINDLDVSHQIEEIKEAETNVRILTEKMENISQMIRESSKNNKDEIERIAQETEALTAKLDEDISSKILEVRENLEKEEHKKGFIVEDFKTYKSSSDYYKASLSDAEAQIEQMKRNEQKVQELEVKKVIVQNEIKDWTFLTKAFDKTGIPVLKLENSGIEITTIANELLSLFENKFRIVFETTQLKADKKSYKESFNINIVEEDGVCEISNKSGGQQVWLETAIQSAISLVVRQQGRNIQTSFLDEKDGALDLDNAHSYIEMISKAHQMSGVHNTFVITHRTELLDFIPQQIKLADGLLTIMN